MIAYGENQVGFLLFPYVLLAFYKTKMLPFRCLPVFWAQLLLDNLVSWDQMTLGVGFCVHKSAAVSLKLSAHGNCSHFIVVRL